MTKDEEDQAIYAIALLTRSELTALGPAFDRAWPIDLTPCFADLLQSIDDAESINLSKDVRDDEHSLKP